MNQQSVDPSWQQLQSRIDNFVGRFLKEDFPAIEYRSTIAGLLPLPLEYRQPDVEKVS